MRYLAGFVLVAFVSVLFVFTVRADPGNQHKDIDDQFAQGIIDSDNIAVLYEKIRACKKLPIQQRSEILWQLVEFLDVAGKSKLTELGNMYIGRELLEGKTKFSGSGAIVDQNLRSRRGVACLVASEISGLELPDIGFDDVDDKTKVEIAKTIIRAYIKGVRDAVEKDNSSKKES